MNRQLFPLQLALASLVLLVLAPVAFAGPPLVCHPFDIGDARSLPFQGPAWSAVDTSYDVKRLVADTDALLTPQTPTIVRMETLRRAAVYVRENPVLAAELVDRLKTRAAAAKGSAATQARFDLGYLVATYEQAGMTVKPAEAQSKFAQAIPKDIDAYGLVTQAIKDGGGAEMEFAAALIASRTRNAEYFQHVHNAAAGTKPGSLLARNLESHLGPDLKVAQTTAK